MDRPFVMNPHEYIDSPKKMPNPDDLDFDYGDEYGGSTYNPYMIEYQARQITRLRREKALLREALEDLALAIGVFTLPGVVTRAQRILDKTKE